MARRYGRHGRYQVLYGADGCVWTWTRKTAERVRRDLERAGVVGVRIWDTQRNGLSRLFAGVGR